MVLVLAYTWCTTVTGNTLQSIVSEYDVQDWVVQQDRVGNTSCKRSPALISSQWKFRFATIIVQLKIISFPVA